MCFTRASFSDQAFQSIPMLIDWGERGVLSPEKSWQSFSKCHGQRLGGLFSKLDSPLLSFTNQLEKKQYARLYASLVHSHFPPK